MKFMGLFMHDRMTSVRVLLGFYIWILGVLFTSKVFAGEFQTLTSDYQCRVLFDSKYEHLRAENFTKPIEQSTRCCERKEDEEHFFSYELINQGVPHLDVAAIIRSIDRDVGFQKYYANQVREIKFQGSLDEIDDFLKSWFLTVRDDQMAVNRPFIVEIKSKANEISEEMLKYGKKLQAVKTARNVLFGAGVLHILNITNVLHFLSYTDNILAVSVGYFIVSVYDLFTFKRTLRKKYGTGKGSPLVNFARGIHIVEMDEKYFEGTLPKKLRNSIEKYKSKVKRGEITGTTALYIIFVTKPVLPDPDLFFVAIDPEPATNKFKLTLKWFTNK